MIQDRTFYATAAQLVMQGWCQNAFAKDGCICPYEAIARALGITRLEIPNSVVDELYRATNGVDRANRTIVEKRSQFFGWNDDIERTQLQAYRLLMALSVRPITFDEDDTIYQPEPQAPPRRKRTIRRYGRRPSKAILLASAIC